MFRSRITLRTVTFSLQTYKCKQVRINRAQERESSLQAGHLRLGKFATSCVQLRPNDLRQQLERSGHCAVTIRRVFCLNNGSLFNSEIYNHFSSLRLLMPVVTRSAKASLPHKRGGVWTRKRTLMKQLEDWGEGGSGGRGRS